MGNQCQKVCYQGKQDNLQSSGVNKPKYSHIYSALLNSKVIHDRKQFPDELISQAVKQKLKLMKIDINTGDSKQIRKYQPDQTSIVYIVSDKQNQQQSIYGKREFKPQKAGIATIYVFKKSELLSHSRYQNIFKKFDDQSQNNEQSEHKSKEMTLDRVYTGQINSQMNISNAVVITQNGENYQGNIKGFQYQGQGLMRNAIGTHQYEGQWKQGKPHGVGSQTLVDKFKYEGNFQDGKWNDREGKLILLNSNNNTQYIGTFINGILQGHGQIHTNGNLIYKGQFKNGKEDGRGIWSSPLGQSYDGTFVQGKKQGPGTYYFTPQVKYVGMFKNGKPQGQGQLFEGNKCIRGYWHNGQNILVYEQTVI